MSDPKKITTSRVKYVAFLDYKPAELRERKDWIIIYYVKNPVNGDLERRRIRAPHYDSLTLRRREAKKLCAAINRELEENLPSFFNAAGKTYKPFSECSKLFLDHIQLEIQKGNKRADTQRSYKSFLSMLEMYQREKDCKLNFAAELDRQFIVNYLDWIYFDRANSARTYNNHLDFIRTFANFMIDRGLLAENPVKGILRKANQAKKRQVLTPKLKEDLRAYLPGKAFHFYALCMGTYFCMIRRTEATKLRVRHVDFANDSIFFPAEISKNKKDEFVTIPPDFKTILLRHIGEAGANEYLFGENFKPGFVQLKPKKISDAWELVRKALGFDSKFQFYSLKDSGITDLLSSGMAAIDVRDQARHHDLKITESYTPRRKTSNERIINASFSF